MRSYHRRDWITEETPRDAHRRGDAAVDAAAAVEAVAKLMLVFVPNVHCYADGIKETAAQRVGQGKSERPQGDTDNPDRSPDSTLVGRVLHMGSRANAGNVRRCLRARLEPRAKAKLGGDAREGKGKSGGDKEHKPRVKPKW